MPHRFIRELKEGELIDAVYLVREKSLDTAKNGALYISMEVADKTGVIDGKRWDATKDLFDSFSVDEFVRIKGRVESYKKYPQLKVELLERIDDSSLDMALYLPATDRDINEMLDSFLRELKGVKDTSIKLLLNNIFSDQSIISKFKSAPAATDFHHPCIGGLLEHSLSCVEMVKLFASKYPSVDMDLLVCGAALHDIGKIEELSYKRSFYYTDSGRLIGHIVLGVNLISREMDRIKDFPEELKNLILHIVLSHHGEQEWGSPKRPMCLEAVILHHIDNLDAKVNGFRYFINTYNDPEANWTKYSKMFREFLYKKVRT